MGTPRAELSGICAKDIARICQVDLSTARYVVDAIAATPYMQASVGGYRFTDGRPAQ